MFKYLTVLLLALNAPSAFAGKEVGNGGDVCENRIQEIRDDLKSWIKQGGHKGLALPMGVTVGSYKRSMLRQIATATISCSDQTIEVRGVEKMCVNKTGSRKSSIVCNRKSFNMANAQNQYVLIHHEYAGLAGLEINRSEASQYEISNQLSSYLIVQKVAKLALRKRPVQPPNGIHENFDSFVGDYKILDCEVRQNKERPERVHKCDSKFVQFYYSTQYFPPANPGEQESNLKLVANFTDKLGVPMKLDNIAYATSQDDMICTTFPGIQGCASELNGFIFSTSIRNRDGKVYYENTFSSPDPSRAYLFRQTSAVLEKLD